MGQSLTRLPDLPARERSDRRPKQRYHGNPERDSWTARDVDVTNTYGNDRTQRPRRKKHHPERRHDHWEDPQILSARDLRAARRQTTQELDPESRLVVEDRGPRHHKSRKAEAGGTQRSAHTGGHSRTEPQPRHRTHSHAHANVSQKTKRTPHVTVTEIPEPRPSKTRSRKKGPEKEPLTRDCMICSETRPVQRFPFRSLTAQCTHENNTCRSCVRKWIRSEFASKIWDQMSCPECRARLQYEDMRDFAPEEVFRKYDRLNTKAALEAIPNFRWCIMKGCKSGQVHDDQAGMTPRFRCVGCKKSHCITHQTAWHRNETCAEYEYRTNGKLKQAENQASRNLIKELAKPCPQCKWNIEKISGCDHMTCTKCRHQFCWLCTADWKLIQRHGNRMHRATCVMHSM